MDTETFRKTLETFRNEADSLNLTLQSNPSVVRRVSGTRTRVSWATHEVATWEPGTRDSFASYCKTISSTAFTVLLRSGATIELSADFERDAMVSYRFVYRPCPVTLPDELDYFLEQMLLPEIVHEEFLRKLPALGSGVLQASVIRMEYSADEASETHPTAHCHINLPTTRIATSRLVSLPRFLEFVAHHFEPQLSPSIPGVTGAHAAFETMVLVEEHRKGIHMHFVPQEASFT